MRKDAEKHRLKLLDAATRVFIRSGCDAPLDLVLTEAGLGRGTLYRHFATRGDLIDAVLDAEFARMVAFVNGRRRSSALLHDFLQECAAVGVLAVSATNILGEQEAQRVLEPLAARAAELYTTVIDDAVEMGVLHPPFGIDDLLLLMRMVIAAGSQEATQEGRRQAMAKGIDVIFHGLINRSQSMFERAV